MANTYTIMISEEQRKALIVSLEFAIDLWQTSADDIDECLGLKSMFEELPAEEDSAPGTLHGFCL